MSQKKLSAWARGLTPRGIVTVGNPIIHTPTEQVKNIADARSVYLKMVRRLEQLHGQGLAAPQIGIGLKVAVIKATRNELRPQIEESPLYILINPRILKRFGPKRVDWEGCFSIPGMVGRVARHTCVEVEYQDPTGKKHQETFTGYLARVVQHECDHLDGRLYIDQMGITSRNFSTVANHKQFHLRK